MAKHGDIRFRRCNTCLGNSLPEDVRIRKKYQIVKCTGCGHIFKVRLSGTYKNPVGPWGFDPTLNSNYRAEIKWCVDWQEGNKKFEEMDAKALKVELNNGWAVKIIGPKKEDIEGVPVEEMEG